MQTINPYLKQYKKNEMEMATPEQVLILLYDGAIQYLNQAKIALTQEDSEEFQSNILGCEKIIIEFMNTLKIEQGGKLAETLYRLYEYLNATLVTATIHRDVEKIDEVLNHLINLRQTWQKAIEISNAEKEANLKDQRKDDENYQDDDNYNDNYNDSYNDNEYDSEDDDEDDEDLE